MEKIDVKYDCSQIYLKYYPKIAIIMLTKDRNDLVEQCINSIIDTTSYPKDSLKLYIANNGTDSEKTSQLHKLCDGLNDKLAINIKDYNYYNFAKLNNDMVFNVIDKDTELILFMNNDIKLLNDVITRMAKIYEDYRSVGTVGCRLHYSNGTVQHAGVLVGCRNNKYFMIHECSKKDYGKIIHKYNANICIANTGACLMTKKDLFTEIGGFNEEYIVCFKDVEYNLNLFSKGYYNITDLTAVAYHYESLTRNKIPDRKDLMRIYSFIKGSEKIKNFINNITL